MRLLLCPFLLLCLLGTVPGCREDQPATPGAAARGQLKKMCVMSARDPSRVSEETEYQYGSDGKLARTLYFDFDFIHNEKRMKEYTHYTYDTGGRLVREATFYPGSPEDGHGDEIHWEAFFEYKDDLLTRRKLIAYWNPAEYVSAYTYDGGPQVRKMVVSGKQGPFLHYDYVYDGAGNLIRKTKHDASGKLLWYSEYAYRDGLMHEEKSYRKDPDGDKINLWITCRYTYDAQNRLASEVTECVHPQSRGWYPPVKYEYY